MKTNTAKNGEELQIHIERTQERDAERDTQKELDAKNAELREHERRNDAEWRENAREEAAAIAEKDTFKYKASRFLDNILDRADDITASGASWLKRQMNAGDAWLNKTVNNFGADMRVNAVKVTNALNSIMDKADNATAAGAQFLQNMFGSREEAPENVVLPEDVPTRSMPQQSSGRQYNGVSQKAEIHGLGVNGGPVGGTDNSASYTNRPTDSSAGVRRLENAEAALQKAREQAGWKMTSQGYSGPSTPEVQAATEEYLRLRQLYG